MGENINIKKEIKYIEIFILIFALAIFLVVLGKYTYKTILNEYNSFNDARNLKAAKQLTENYKCAIELITINIDGGKICRKPDVDNNIYTDIFDKYPRYGKGADDIFKFLSRGDILSANSIIKGNLVIPGYNQILLNEKIQWTEDPFNSSAWRLEFYGLRSLRHLFFSYNLTGDTTYLKKAEEIVVDFIDKDVNKINSWKDYNAVAFRSLFLTKLWWQLRENNLLTYEVSTKILKSIQKHADFLSDPNHYDKGSVNDVNEAGALYSIASNFPEFPESKKWLEVATERLNDGIESSVDSEGVVIEKSPSYQYLLLEKYWEVYLFSQNQGQPLSSIFTDRLQSMVNYSTFVIQPNNQIPLINATTKKEISYTGIYQEIADTFPEFKYAITKGAEGLMPEVNNKIFKQSGQAILRSGWGNQREFDKEVQVIFEAGPNRSNKNDFNALSFNLYGNGKTLISDSGNYSGTNNLFKNYFKSTISSNTITVDGLSQSEGFAQLGEFKEGKNYSAQSAFSNLYKGVDHKRTLILIENKYLIIIDKLESRTEHVYKQTFNLSPGLEIEKEKTSVNVKNGNEEIMRIFQIDNENIKLETFNGNESLPGGICSFGGDAVVPCNSLRYSQNGNNVSFYTLIEIGPHDESLSYDIIDESISINSSRSEIRIDLNEVVGNEEKIVVNRSELPFFNKAQVVGVNALDWNTKDQNQAGGRVQTISDDDGSFLEFTTPNNGEKVSANIPVELDLSSSNLMLRMKVRERPSVNSIQISLYTNGGKGSMSIDLRNSYRDEDNQSWLNISLGKGSFRKTAGRWVEHGEGFDWSKIDKIQVSFSALSGVIAELQISEISMTPQQDEGEVVIIFDDGYESILPAIEVMRSYGFKGNIAVIADTLETNQRGYLSVKQLQKIKDDYGWDIINHTEHHLSAVSNYANKNKLEEYEEDVTNGAKFLIRNNLNSNPNWMVYPHGTTDDKIKSIIKKYYLFARTTINQPESFPFADPYSVKTISADTGESSNSNVVKFIPVEDIMSAVVDAKNYKLPLFITFHRINSSTSDRPGYGINDFKRLMSLINQEKIKVVTLSEFDSNHGISKQSMELIEQTPSEIKVNVDIKEKGALDFMMNKIKRIFTRN